MKMLLMCLATALSLTTSSSVMAELDRPSAIRPSTSRSRGVSRTRRVVAPPDEELCDDLGIQCGAAGGDPLQRLDERVDVGHPVVEEAAVVAGVLGEQVGGVALLYELGEHEDGRWTCSWRSRSRPAWRTCSSPTIWP